LIVKLKNGRVKQPRIAGSMEKEVGTHQLLQRRRTSPDPVAMGCSVAGRVFVVISSNTGAVACYFLDNLPPEAESWLIFTVMRPSILLGITSSAWLMTL
jgi:hypothetical protein